MVAYIPDLIPIENIKHYLGSRIIFLIFEIKNEIEIRGIRLIMIFAENS